MRIISESTDEPITLDEAADNLRVVLNNDSPPVYPEAGRILKLIKAARQSCEEDLELSLVFKTLEVTQDCLYPRTIELPGGPVRSIVSLTYVDEEGYDTALADDQYRLSTSGRMAVLYPAYGVTWPDHRRDHDSVRVIYTAGYPSLDSPPEVAPEPIIQAMHLCIAHWFANREAVDIGNITTEIPLGAQYLLGKYRRGMGV